MASMPILNFAFRHDRLTVVRTATRWTAWIVMANGAVALIIALAGPARLGGWMAGVVPMSPVLAVAHVATGLALWAFIERRRRLHIASAGIAVLLGLAALTLVARPAETAIPTSVASSLLSLFASTPLVAAWFRGRSGLVHITFGVAGFALLSLSVTVIGVRVVGAFGPDTERIFVGGSTEGLASSILLSLCFLGLIWAEGFSTTEPPRWVATAAGTSTLLAVLLLWRALDMRETEQLRSQTLLVAQVEREAIYREVRAAAGSFRRAAEQASRAVPVDQSRTDLASLVRDLPGLTAAMRVSAAGDATVSMPQDFDVSSLSAAWRSRVGTLGAFDTLSYIPLDSGVNRFAIVSPVCRTGACDGAVVGIYDARVLFSRVLENAQNGFLSIVHRDGHVLGTDSLRVPESSWREELPLRLGAAEWQLSALPTAETVGRMRTTLPASVLFMGLIVSALLPVTLLLGQAAWRNARTSERERLSSALERATDGIWEWDLITGQSGRSESLWRHLGYAPPTVAPGADGWTALIHPDDREHVEGALARHISGGAASFEAEYRVRDRAGTWHIIVDRGRIVDRLPDGTAARLLGIRADVTEARLAADARDESERRFRAIFDSGFQFQLLLDEDGTVLEVNRASLQRAAVPADLVIGRPIWDALWWPANAASATQLREGVASARRGTTVHYETEITDLSGATLILEVGLKGVHDARGRATQLLLEARDVTAKRRVDSALRELETLAVMGRIAARVAHEINNPLAGIQYSFLLLKDAIPKEHPQFKYVGAIEREISRIAAVTRQLYETYRPERDTGVGASLSTTIGDATAFLEQVNRASAVRIETDLSGAPSIVSVSPAVLRQVVYNLVQNAMDASPPDKTVRIKATVIGDALELRVADSGPGIAPDIHQRIFEPFFSTKDSRMRTSGMGLGLALVHQTVKSAGGQIHVEQAPGGGALFIVTLPLASPSATEVA